MGHLNTKQILRLALATKKYAYEKGKDLGKNGKVCARGGRGGEGGEGGGELGVQEEEEGKKRKEKPLTWTCTACLYLTTSRHPDILGKVLGNPRNKD